MSKTKNTTDAVRILHDRYIQGKPRKIRALEKEHEKAEIAARIYELRTTSGLTQQGLAKLVGTRQSVISRLEDADYRGHSFRMLQRVASALHCRVKVDIVPVSHTHNDPSLPSPSLA